MIIRNKAKCKKWKRRDIKIHAAMWEQQKNNDDVSLFLFIENEKVIGLRIWDFREREYMRAFHLWIILFIMHVIIYARIQK